MGQGAVRQYTHKTSRFSPLIIRVSLLLILGQTGCRSAYYEAWELVGVHKRDLLVDSIKDARESQDEAKQQFESALEQFASVVDFDGGELEDVYHRLRMELLRSEARGKEVQDRIETVETVSRDLFEEWESELAHYANASLRGKSEQKLRETEKRCDELIEAMRRAEAHIAPVLRPFRDQVLYLKHNLNAQAVAALRGELVNVEEQTGALILELERAIAEADTLIAELERTEGAN